MASGSRAMPIPPCALAVIFASVAKFSSGRLLLALIVPGILLALAYAAFIVLTAKLRPDLAPAYDVRRAGILEKLKLLGANVLPLSIVVFLVIGVIFLGIRSEEHTSELQSLMRISYAVFCLKTKIHTTNA